jgi:hypothetical protein
MAVSSAWLAGSRYAASVLLAGTRLHPTDCLAAVLQSQNRCIPLKISALDSPPPGRTEIVIETIRLPSR